MEEVLKSVPTVVEWLLSQPGGFTTLAMIVLYIAERWRNVRLEKRLDAAHERYTTRLEAIIPVVEKFTDFTDFIKPVVIQAMNKVQK